MDELVKAFISRSALKHNFRLIQKTAANKPLCPIVKADAYGHKAVLIARALAGMKAAFWGVATINEAMELRDLNVRGPLIVLPPLTRCEPEKKITGQIKLMRRLGIRPTLANDDSLELIAKTAPGNSSPLYAHIKVDTGMGRNGCPVEEALALLRKASATPGLIIEGIYSHLASTSSANLGFARKQIAVFNSLLEKIKALGINIPIKHMANSDAIFKLTEARFDMVRPGKALYGYSTQNSKKSLQLIPIMRIEAPVIFSKWVKKGTTCGYDQTFRVKRKTRIGLLPLGYADGYSRRWSNTGLVSFKKQLVPVIGRVSMDLTTVDLTDIPEATTGSSLCVVSNRRADPHSIESMAEKLDTILYEITCSFKGRIQRILTE